MRRTVGAIKDAFISRTEPVEAILAEIIQYSQVSRRKGLIALETEIDRAGDPFLKLALGLAVDGTNAKVARQILNRRLTGAQALLRELRSERTR